MPQPPEGEQEEEDALELLRVELVVPNREMLFLHFVLWHCGHSTSTALEMERTNLSKV